MNEKLFAVYIQARIHLEYMQFIIDNLPDNGQERANIDSILPQLRNMEWQIKQRMIRDIQQNKP